MCGNEKGHLVRGCPGRWPLRVLVMLSGHEKPPGGPELPLGAVVEVALDGARAGQDGGVAIRRRFGQRPGCHVLPFLVRLDGAAGLTVRDGVASRR